MTAAATVATNSGVDVDTANCVESAWWKLKGLLLMLPPNFVVSPSTTTGNQKPGGGMKRCTKLYKKDVYRSRSTVPWRKEAWQRRPEGENAYTDTKHVSKHAVWLAKSEAEKEESTTVSPDGDGVWRFIKQMDCRNQDIVGENCVCNDAGGDIMKAWVESYAGLLIVEFEWPSNELPEFPPTAALPNPTPTPHRWDAVWFCAW